MKKSKEISEFDKIYIAKYCDFVRAEEMGKSFNISSNMIKDIILELKKSGLYDIYKNISDEEWERLEKKSNEYIKEKYLLQYKEKNKAMFKQILDAFAIDINEVIRQFTIFEYKKDYFDRDYFYKENYEGEEWKQIGDLNYLLSNYGRIKNKTTKKLKQLKYNKFGMQVLLWQNSKSYTITISRLVANLFIRKVDKNERVFHKNNNIRDNYYKNLYIEKIERRNANEIL